MWNSGEETGEGREGGKNYEEYQEFYCKHIKFEMPIQHSHKDAS